MLYRGMSNQYIEILISNINRKDEDLLTAMLFDFGAGGVSEDLQFTQKEDTYDPITIESPVFSARAFFEEVPDMENLKQQISQFEGVTLKVSTQQKKDWLEEWKKGFESFELVDGYWVVPSWLKSPVDSEHSIYIDPGMAFGTGTHDTTQIASQFLLELKNEKINSLLDVGTGSGILSILAEKIGFQKIEATEIDADARQVAVENVKKNNCLSILVHTHQIEDVESCFDVVLANIIDGILIQLQDDLKRCCKVGGTLILTGILEERRNVFLEGFDFSGFEILKWKSQGDWLGLVAKRVK